VVDNRAGASGNIGAAATAKSPPDGYTFMVTSNASIAIGPGLYASLPFDAERDFTPIAQGVFAPMVVVAHAGSGIRTLAQLIQRGKQKPGESFYGSAGVGTSPFLGVKMLESLTGAKFEHVPYKGVAPAYQDLISGRLQFMYPDLASIQPFIRSGQVVALAINRETDLLPNVPSFEKAGVNGMAAHTTFSVVGPAGVAPNIVAKLSATINTAMKSPAFASRLKELALIPIFDTPAEFAANLKKERDYWAVFISRNGIKPE
jgi:tripartite-type tricarboxylate transporter receptor subunit TctC